MMTNTSTSHRPLIIGSLTMDVLLQVPHLPARQQDINIAAQQMKSGGCAYNVYEAVKCCGGQPHFAGVVGKGAFADAVRKEVGHDPHMILFDSDEENGCCYCLVEPDGERTFICVHGAEYRFRAQWLSQLDPASYGWLYLCGIDLEEAQNACLIQFAIHSGLRLMLAPGPRLTSIQEQLSLLMPLHPTLHLNEQEAQIMSGQQDAVQAALALRAQGADNVIITLGSSGSIACGPNGTVSHAARKVEVTDTIGAGDAHAGACLYALSQGMTLNEMLELADATAERALRCAGAWRQE